MSYQAHDAFVAPARHRAELWRLGAGLVTGVVIVYGLGWAVQAIAMAVLSAPDYADFRTAVASPHTPAGALYLLLSLGLLIVAAAMVANQIHGRGLRSLIGAPRMAGRQFVRVLAYLAVLYTVVSALPPWELPAPLEPGLPSGLWLALLPLSLLAVLVQTSAEEIVFRGYIQQQLAARFGPTAIWMAGPAILFAALHYRPGMGNAGWLFMLWAGVFSVAASDITARAGTLGPAIALHFASNVVAIVLVSGDPDLTGLALWRMQIDITDPAVLWPVMSIDLAMLLVSWLVIRLALRR
jgi:membrane protease YdiL (CAAX protease family)